MAHPLVLGLFDDAAAAAGAARALREIGYERERLSIVARTHDEQGAIARSAGASPGAEIEDSRPAGRLGELSAHFIAAIAFVMPGIGPIVADGPLAAGLGEAAGHLAGDLVAVLTHAGMTPAEAESWRARIEAGAVLLGVHTNRDAVAAVAQALERHGAGRAVIGTWSDFDD